MPGSDAQDNKKSGMGTFAALLILGVLFFAGAIANFIPPPKLASLQQESGILIGVSDNIKRRSNNTALTIADAAGERRSYEIKSSIRFSAIRDIRKAAREQIGSEVLYRADARTMFEMISGDGKVLVSSSHVEE